MKKLSLNSSNMAKFAIRKARMKDLKGFRECLGSVAHARKPIGSVEAPPLRDARKWMKSVLGARYPFLVVTDGSKIVGWCDVGHREREGFRHTAELGIGLSAKVRGHGLGSRLLKGTIALSRRRGIEKLELQVYASNVAARRLYRKFGFKVEGRRIRGRKLDGRYDDVVLMALFLTADKAPKRT